jgi:PPOX class probable F420-dependent enzyme
MPESLPAGVRALIDAGPIAHIVCLEPDGRPHVSMAWIGLEGEDIVVGTLADQRKLRNMRRDPRVALSFTTGARTPYGLDEYVVLHGHARIVEGGAAALLQRLAHTYLGPDIVFPGIPNPPPGFVTHIAVERVEGLGAWTEQGG